ncbi:hypothetical protein HDV00_000742 [Rhizophlyctis rosea]|nr:hypothetical protein HDV00_000742 [Rhizophlyctis rosea]
MTQSGEDTTVPEPGLTENNNIDTPEEQQSTRKSDRSGAVTVTPRSKHSKSLWAGSATAAARTLRPGWLKTSTARSGTGSVWSMPDGSGNSLQQIYQLQPQNASQADHVPEEAPSGFAKESEVPEDTSKILILADSAMSIHAIHPRFEAYRKALPSFCFVCHVGGQIHKAFKKTLSSSSSSSTASNANNNSNGIGSPGANEVAGSGSETAVLMQDYVRDLLDGLLRLWEHEGSFVGVFAFGDAAPTLINLLLLLLRHRSSYPTPKFLIIRPSSTFYTIPVDHVDARVIVIGSIKETEGEKRCRKCSSIRSDLLPTARDVVDTIAHIITNDLNGGVGFGWEMRRSVVGDVVGGKGVEVFKCVG